MAKYNVTYSCGHTGVVNLIGKIKDREWKLEREAMKLCPECWKIEAEKMRQEENKRAAEASKEQGLPELVGTEKQVAWANTIRLKLLKQIEEDVKTEIEYLTHGRKARAEELEMKYNVVVDFIKAKTSASWWIDHRNLRFSGVLMLIEKEYENMQTAKLEAPAEVVEEIKNEATVYPENPITTTVAEIRPLEGKIEISFPERRDDFRELVKQQLKMSWSGQCWVREIYPKNGTIQDRTAEAGHRLLAAGFPIRIFDNEIREKAIKGDYEQEYTNWIQVRTQGDYEGWFAISWDKNDDYYKAARQIPGSRWSKPSVVVPPEKFEEVLDFAKMYGFKLSEKAQELADTERKKKEAALIVSVEAPEEKEKVFVTGKPPVLEVPAEVDIDDDLKD